MVGKKTHNNNFWVYSILQEEVTKKIIFRKLQDTVCVCHVGVPLWGTNTVAIKDSTRNEEGNDINIPSSSTHLWR